MHIMSINDGLKFSAFMLPLFSHECILSSFVRSFVFSLSSVSKNERITVTVIGYLPCAPGCDDV